MLSYYGCNVKTSLEKSLTFFEKGEPPQQSAFLCALESVNPITIHAVLLISPRRGVF
jgi:hypothetical protein